MTRKDMSKPLIDHDSRTRAATDFESNPVVVAGAGTGKTGLLVERYLNLILSERASLDATIAITFTEKAAGEMKTRVIEALEDIMTATDPDRKEVLEESSEAGRSHAWLAGKAAISEETLHRRAAEALDGLEAAYIGTIHAYCSDLLRRYPTHADLPPEFSIDEGFGQDFLFEEVWSEFLTEELGANPTRPDLWQRILSRFLEREIEEVAASLIRDPVACDHLAEDGYLGLDVQAAYEDEVRELIAVLRGYQEQILPVKRTPNFSDTLETQITLFEMFLKDGTQVLREIDTDTLSVSDIFTRTNPFTPKPKPGFEDQKEAMIEKAKRGLKLLRRLYRVHDMAFPDLMDGLRPFAQRFRKRIRHDGTLSFSDLLLITRNLLRDHPEVREAEAHRTRAILVDEFQDTDPLQYEIVFLLATRAKGKVDDPYQAPLHPGRLFIVGDPKQSIYRFRGADISAYALATRHITGGESPADLVTNFRSRPEVLTPLNRLFEDWIGVPEDPEVEPEYSSIEPFRPKVGEPRVELWSVQAKPNARAEARRREEAAHLAHQVKQWVDNGDYGLRDMALLFRALGDVPIYTRALREAGVRYVVDGGKAFAERPEVVEALCLLKALANPADPVATLGVLRSSFGGVPDTMLADYASKQGPFRWTTRVDRDPLPEFPVINRAFKRLSTLDRERRKIPLDRWIQKTLTESEFTLLMTAYFEGAQRLANVRKLAERAASLARERGFTLEQTITALEDEFNGERVEGESPLADEGIEALRILTIHKAKGLEYDVVLIPDISRTRPGSPRTTQATLMRYRGRPHLAVWMSDRMKVQNTAASIMDEDSLRHEDAENKRLLYVATTRARERLILVNSSPKQNPQWLKQIANAWGYQRDKKNLDNPYPEDGTLLAGDGVLHRLLDKTPKASYSAVETTNPETEYLGFLAAREKASSIAIERFRNPSSDHKAVAEEAVSEGGMVSHRDPDLARAAGTAVHALLEHWDFDDPAGLQEAAPRVVEAAALEYQVDESALGKDVETILTGFLASELPEYLAGVEVLGREVPVLFRDPDQTTVNGYVDIVYRHDGRVHVADYKTDEITTAEHAKIYTSQLADYAFAIGRDMNLSDPPVGEVLFVRSGDRIPVTEGKESTS